MLFTRRMDYGLRIMLTLGLDPQARLSAEEVAQQVDVPRPFVLKIVRQLAEAGLVDARRGPGGGARLAREAEEVSVLDILRAADSPRALNACLLEPRACSRSGTCAAHRLLRPVQETLDRELEQLTLADLVREQRAIDAG
jgi:Rrf2 family protein